MKRRLTRFAFYAAVLAAPAAAFAQGAPPRLALVIGEAQYRSGPLATAANDAGLMADMLRQAGFDVTGAANLSQDQIRESFREFLAKVSAAGPQAEVFVYLSGRGLQFSGENYLAPVEATIANSASVPAEAVRLTDFLGPLEGLPAQGRIVVLDLARPNDFGKSGQPLAGGLGLVDAPDGTLIGFDSAPGTISQETAGPYGPYAQSLVEMLRQPGLPIDDAFDQVRLRVNQATKGAQTPWNVTKLSASIALFQPAPNAPPRPAFVSRQSAARRPLRGMQPADAYGYAIERDTLDGYQDFLGAFPGDPLAQRIRVMLAARREALTWQRAFYANTPEAYWTYLRRYPRGPHAPDCERRLAFLTAPLEPPPRFALYDYDVPPPPPDEIVYFGRPVIYVNEYATLPPPPFGVELVPVIAPEYRQLPPPPPSPGFGFLPIPVPIPIPFARPVPQQGVVVAPRFVQQSVGQGGQGAAPGAGGQAPAGGARALPQGYSQAPAQAPGTAPGALPGGRPGAPSGSPGVTPSQTAPSQAAPSQALPRPGQPGGPPAANTLPRTNPAPNGVPANERGPAGTAAPPQTLPNAARPSAEPVRPQPAPQVTQPAPVQTAPRPEPREAAPQAAPPAAPKAAPRPEPREAAPARPETREPPPPRPEPREAPPPRPEAPPHPAPPPHVEAPRAPPPPHPAGPAKGEPHGEHRE